VVGVTHECDWPPEAAGLPRVTASELESDDLSSAQIDAAVAESAREGKRLYAIDEVVWEQVRADVVVAQELCDVCAVSAGEVRRLDVEVIDYSPATLDGE
jgi:iron complex transport system substrate-binding protein